ncbi:hypothetical protein [Methylocella sp.]|uniref:hypothetical protein n=1 Tax=Methylocella sp. TaxID=1978226 RepID=UPI0037832546
MRNPRRKRTPFHAEVRRRALKKLSGFHLKGFGEGKVFPHQLRRARRRNLRLNHRCAKFVTELRIP